MKRSALALLLLTAACVPQLGNREAVLHAPRAVAGAHPGGTIRVGATRPDALDPALVQDPGAKLVIRTMCDQLVALDPATGRPVPSIASSWSISEGGRRLFLRLRNGVVFTNGRPLRAEDVAASLSRLASERLASPSASLLEHVFGFGFVHGDDQTRDERARVRLLGVSVVDPLSLEISLDRPDAEFIRVLADAATTPVPRDLTQDDPAAFERQPVCAGPYRLAAPWTAGTTIRLERSAGYKPSSAAWTRNGASYADAIEFVPFADRTAAARAFAAGTVDVALAPEAAAASPDLVRGVSAQVEFVGFPTTQPPFDDPRVREALSRALDRTALARTIFGGSRAVARSFLSPALGEAYETDACGPHTPAGADVAGARALFRAAGVDPRRMRVPFSVNDEGSNRALATAVAAQWRAALGVEATLAPVPFQRYLDLGSRAQGFEGVFRFSWAPAVSSPSRVFEPLFMAGGIGKNNFSLFDDRDLTDAIRGAAKAADAVDRARAFERAGRILCDAMPMAPLLYATRASLVRRSALASATGRWLDAWNAQPLLRELFFS